MHLLRYSVAMCVISTGLIGADNPFLGTWTLNSAKSKYNPGPAPKNLTVTFEADGEKIRRTATGVDGEGNPIKQGGDSILWDGKDYPIQAASGGPPVTVAVMRVNDHTNQVTVKEAGKTVATVQSVVSKDGKTMTNTIVGTNPKGEKVNIVEVLDKE